MLVLASELGEDRCYWWAKAVESWCFSPSHSHFLPLAFPPSLPLSLPSSLVPVLVLFPDPNILEANYSRLHKYELEKSYQNHIKFWVKKKNTHTYIVLSQWDFCVFRLHQELFITLTRINLLLLLYPRKMVKSLSSSESTLFHFSQKVLPSANCFLVDLL